MRLPVGAIGPEHTHHDVEEVFYVLEGELEVTVHDVDDGTRTATRTLGYRDLVRVPRACRAACATPATTDALFCVVIGSPKPQLPTYPASSPMHGSPATDHPPENPETVPCPARCASNG